MPVERSAGVIVFKNTAQGRKYLVLRSSRHSEDKPASPPKPERRREFWDLSKGVLDKGEKGIDAALRELKEETGLENLKVIPDFKTTVSYFTRHSGPPSTSNAAVRASKPVPKFVAMFLAQANNADEIKLSWEHDKYEWLGFEEAKKRLSNPAMKKAIDAAEEFLKV